jgi:hypothetical protein
MLTLAVVASVLLDEAVAVGPPMENRLAPKFPFRSSPEFC